jgi:hypothetical protein
VLLLEGRDFGEVFLAGDREFRPLFRCVNCLSSQELRALEQSRPAGFEDWNGRRSKDNWEALSSWNIHTSWKIAPAAGPGRPCS